MSLYNIEESILFEDEYLLVCYKCPGGAGQTAKGGIMDMERLIKNYLSKKLGSGKPPYLAVVHRLDQPVEGVMVFAKTPHAARELNRQLTQGRMGKEYLAVTMGIPPEKAGILENELVKDGRNNVSRVVPEKTSGSKHAVLEYEVLETKEGKALVRIKLKTGRHHQIRVQMANIGCPLLGDKKYNVNLMEDKRTTFPALCSSRLCFFHPKTGKPMEFTVIPKGEGFIL
mgnify:FL=1